MRTVIIADDLTGACDTAVKMCGGGKSVKVYLGNEIAEIEEPGAAVNTNSRSLRPEKAFEKLAALAGELGRQEGVRIYKKIDSLFRGNVMAEAQALMEGLEYECVLINAAVPGNHREVRDGKLAASNSVFNGTDIIAAAFRGKEEECVSIPLETVRGGSKALASAIGKAVSEGKKFLIVDSETKEDVAVTAEAALQFENILLSGAAGFIVPLMEEQPAPGEQIKQKEHPAPGEQIKQKEQPEQGVQKGQSPQDRPDQQVFAEGRLSVPGQKNGPLLYVMGTNNPVTVKQAACLKRTENLPVITVHAGEVLIGNKAPEKERGVDEAAAIMQSGPEAVLLTVTDPGGAEPDRADQHGTDPRCGFNAAAENEEIAQCCTDIAAALAEKFSFRGMVISGGTTAQQLLEKMGICYIRVLTEFAPGVPVAIIEDEKYGKMLIATKSGGYGEEETLSDLKAFL